MNFLSGGVRADRRRESGAAPGRDGNGNKWLSCPKL